MLKQYKLNVNVIPYVITVIWHIFRFLVSTLTVHFISSTYHISAPCSPLTTDCSPSVSLRTLLATFHPVFQWSGPHRTTTEQVLLQYNDVAVVY